MEYDTIKLSCGYGSRFDRSDFDFCSDKCLREWIEKMII